MLPSSFVPTMIAYYSRYGGELPALLRPEQVQQQLEQIREGLEALESGVKGLYQNSDLRTHHSRFPARYCLNLAGPACACRIWRCLLSHCPNGRASDRQGNTRGHTQSTSTDNSGTNNRSQECE